MAEAQVMIVPETHHFIKPVSHENKVWTNKSLGKPKVKERNVRYLLPYWLSGDEGGDRVYHILKVQLKGDAYEFELGNSFLLPEPLTALKQRRRFSYKKLSQLGMVEIKESLLIPLPR